MACHGVSVVEYSVALIHDYKIMCLYTNFFFLNYVFHTFISYNLHQVLLHLLQVFLLWRVVFIPALS